jgi:hypothetical protein
MPLLKLLIIVIKHPKRLQYLYGKYNHHMTETQLFKFLLPSFPSPPCRQTSTHSQGHSKNDMKTRTAGLAAITVKEFAQWIAPFESTVATATVRHRHQHQHRQGSSSPTDIEESFRQQQREDGNKNAIVRNVGIAVSGGVDSMALATLLARHYSLQGSSTRLHALIVDHKLRDNSTEEANYVAHQVQKLSKKKIRQ